MTVMCFSHTGLDSHDLQAYRVSSHHHRQTRRTQDEADRAVGTGSDGLSGPRQSLSHYLSKQTKFKNAFSHIYANGCKHIKPFKHTAHGVPPTLAPDIT